jgi:hypothetical protein
MTFRGSPEQNPLRIRTRNPDGTCNVHCRKCGYFICTMSSRGFQTALCHYCHTGEIRPLTPREELLKTLYTDPDEGTIEKLARPKNKFNVLDLMINTFSAIGFGNKKEKQIDQEAVKYPTADAESSKAVAKRKKREPIFQFNKEKK